MNRSVFSLLFFIAGSMTMFSQNETKEDSLIIRSETKKDSRTIDLTSQQKPLDNSRELDLDNRKLHDKTESGLPNYLNYNWKLTPNLKTQKLFSGFSYSPIEYDCNYEIGSYRQAGVGCVYKPLDKLTIFLGGYIVNY